MALPRSSLATSGQVRVLASSPAAKQAATEVPDRVLRTLETQNFFALETLSLSDSLLTGLGKMLFPLDSVGHDEESIPVLGSFDDEVSREALFFTVSALGRCSSSLADALANSYANTVLLRRDAVLARSVLPPEVHSNFRALPLHNSDLFGPQVKDLFKEVSESARDSAFLRLPAPVTGQPAKSFDTRRHRGGWKRKPKKSPVTNSSASAPRQGRFGSGGRGRSEGPSL